MNIRYFKNVHVSWIILMKEMVNNKLIMSYSIDKVYSETNTVDISCYILQEKIEEFDNLCLYNGGEKNE
jgi:hypothetical protein